MEQVMETSGKRERSTFKIEKAESADAVAINEVSRRAWQTTYPNEEFGITTEDIQRRTEGADGTLIEHKIEQWRNVIESSGENHEIFVAHSDNEVVGFVSPRIVKNGERRIAAIYVSPDAQGSGYGAALLLSALEWHGSESDIYLHVVAYNQQAIDFYERFGFIQTGRSIEDRLSQVNGFAELPIIEMLLKSSDK
jgi:RimJ/RimL family protein N-acetyltransferase